MGKKEIIMIDPKELRIGNLVFAEGFTIPGIPVEVRCVYENYIHTADIGKTVRIVIAHPCERISPITLTPEWLERMGFENKISPKGEINWAKFSQYHFAFVLKQISGHIGFAYYSNGTEHALQLNYVHQLMNLYFALTGQELEIKKP